MGVEFISVREAAKNTGRTENKVRSLIHQGKLRIVRVGYHILIPRSELRKLQPAARES